MKNQLYKKLYYNNFNYLVEKVEVVAPINLVQRFEDTYYYNAGNNFLIKTLIKKRGGYNSFYKLLRTDFQYLKTLELPENARIFPNANHIALWFEKDYLLKLYDENFELLKEQNLGYFILYDSFYLTIIFNKNNDVFLKKLNDNNEEIWNCDVPITINGLTIAWNDDFIFFYRQELIETIPAIQYESPEIKIYRNSIVCISQANGKLVWEKDIENLQLGRPILLCDNIIVIKSNSIGLLGLHTTTGQILWNWKLAEETYNKRKAEYNGGGYYFEISLNIYEYTIDYEGKLHIVDFETYSQLNVKTGAILATFDFEKAQKKWKLNRKSVNTPGGHFGLGATPTVTKDHCIAAIRNTVIFINKNTGQIDYIIPGEDKLYGGIKEIAVIGENRLLVYEGCGTRKMPDNILKIWEGRKV